MPSDEPSESSTFKAPAPKTRAAPRPRAVQRKSKAERDEHARREAERAKERQVADTDGSSRGATRVGRGGARGGARGAAKQNERTAVSAGAGVFGAGRGERPERYKGPVDLGTSEALDGHGGVDVTQAMLDTTGAFGSGSGGGGGGGSGGGGIGGGRGRKQEGDPAFQFDDDAEDAGRRDIEKIWISSDEDEDQIVSRKGKQRRTSKTPKVGFGLRPVRAARTIIQEELEEDVAKKKVKKASEDTAVIDVDTDEMQIDHVPGVTTKDAPPSPELTKKILRKSDSKPKDTKILTETIEERAERLRVNEDIEGLRDAFLHRSDTDDTVDSKEDNAVFGRTDHDRMFLFQLPPLIPNLYDPSMKPQQDPEAMDVDQPNIQVKTEPGTAALAVPKEGDKQKEEGQSQPQILSAQASISQRLPSGLAGKLKIHKSGKVTLDWGGTDMEVRYGTEVDFLQDVICVENAPVAEQKEEGAPKQDQVGKVHALGQIRGKMVLIPDWSKLYA